MILTFVRREGKQMAAKDIEIEKIGDQYELSRPQWGEHKAHISADPGLLEKVLKHTWTYKKGEHAYLTTSIKGNDGKRHTVYLHNFVLNYLCGAEKLKKMLEPNNIIEHLDNDGLNCSYTNLHILSDSLNKAKANTLIRNRKKIFYKRFRRLLQMFIMPINVIISKCKLRLTKLWSAIQSRGRHILLSH